MDVADINARIAQDRARREAAERERERKAAQQRDAINAKINAKKGGRPDAAAASSSTSGEVSTPDGPLPTGWETTTSEDGREYFWHPATGRVTWTRPTDADADAEPPPAAEPMPAAPEEDWPLPEGWEEVEADDGRSYYWHVESDEITWTRPAAPPAQALATTTATPAVAAAIPATPVTPPTPACSSSYCTAEAVAAAPSVLPAAETGRHAVLARAAHAANQRGDAAAAKRLFLEALAITPAESASRHRYVMSAANMCLKLDELREAILYYEELETLAAGAACSRVPEDVRARLASKLQLARARLADREACCSPGGGSFGSAASLPPGHALYKSAHGHAYGAMHTDASGGRGDVVERTYETLRETRVVNVLQADTWHGRFDPPPGSAYLPPPPPPDGWPSSTHLAAGYTTAMAGKGLAGLPKHQDGYTRFHDELEDAELGEATNGERLQPVGRCCDGERFCDLLATFIISALLMTIVLGLTGGLGHGGSLSS